MLGLRRPRIAIYDHTWPFIGGAQKYGATIAEALRDVGEITLIGNRPFSTEQLSAWYRLDLEDCSTRLIPLPFFEKMGGDLIDPAEIISRAMANPFHAVSRASLGYDLFINNSMLEMVLPLAAHSLFITHFPERRPRSYFYVDRYDRVVVQQPLYRGLDRKAVGAQTPCSDLSPVDMPDRAPKRRSRSSCRWRASIPGEQTTARHDPRSPNARPPSSHGRPRLAPDPCRRQPRG